MFFFNLKPQLLRFLFMSSKFRFHQKSSGPFCSSSINLLPENTVIKALSVLWMWVRRTRKGSLGIEAGTQILNTWIIIFITRTTLAPPFSCSSLAPSCSLWGFVCPRPPNKDTHHLQNIADNPVPPGNIPRLPRFISSALPTGLVCREKVSLQNHFRPLDFWGRLQGNLFACGPLGQLREIKKKALGLTGFLNIAIWEDLRKEGVRLLQFVLVKSVTEPSLGTCPQ